MSTGIELLKTQLSEYKNELRLELAKIEELRASIKNWEISAKLWEEKISDLEEDIRALEEYYT